MLSALFQKHEVLNLSEQRLAKYHTWCLEEKVPHSTLLKASNRHMIPPLAVQNLLINEVLTIFLHRIGISRFRIWDEGLGWLGFRLIRPGFGDGYPFSCKTWGPAKQVLSVWLPIVGFSTELMIQLIPGSHKKEYPKYLPTDSKFAANEYRLDYKPRPEECLRPTMQPGQALVFDPKTIHSEEVTTGTETRFNLEFRIEPL